MLSTTLSYELVSNEDQNAIHMHDLSFLTREL
jgi:hypothetical protein